MKTWTKGAGVAALASLMVLAGQVTVVLARSGGGKGGSYGGSSHSYSGSLSGGLSGGMSGGYSGLGGFNSFLPFFMLGGHTTGSSGSLFGSLTNLLFLALIGYLVYKLFIWSRRRPQGGSGHNTFGSSKKNGTNNYYGSSSQAPVDLNGQPITNANNLQRFNEAINFTRENMHYYAETFPRWDRDYIVGRVRQVFFWFQDAWSRQDLSQAQEYLDPVLIARYQNDLTAMRARGERNMIKEPVLDQGNIEFVHSHLDDTAEHFVAMVSASLVDYTIDSSGRTIAGDDRYRLYFTEFWEFAWQEDKWVLTNIHQEDSLEMAKIARTNQH